MVNLSLIERTAGTDQAPLEAVYRITKLGESAAEYGECYFPDIVVETKPVIRQRKSI